MCDRLLDTVCRFCLKDNFSLKHIFNCPCPYNEPLSRIMEKIYDLKICEGDGLPSKICVPCLWKVIEFDTYRKNVRHAEEELRKLLSGTCNKSNEVSEAVTDTVIELTAEREMVSTGIDLEQNYTENDGQAEKLANLQNIAKYTIKGIDDDTEVSIKDEIDIVEWEMPQDMLPKEDILENVKSDVQEEVLKDTEVSNKDIQNDEQKQDEIQPEEDTSKVSAAIDLEHSYANIDVQCTEELEELQSSESCDINSSECLGQMDKDFENVSSINNSSVVSTSGLSGKKRANEEISKESVKNDLFTEKESLFSLRSKSGNNSAKSGSSSSGMAVQTKRKHFVCDICKKSCNTKQKVATHVWVHYDDRPYKCRECGKSFKQENVKTVHELRHLKKQKENGGDEKRKAKKSHVGEICKEEFSTQDSLCMHSNLHKNKYSCNFCGKKFGFKHNLNRHLRIHTNEKPFSCEVCKRTFNRKGNLKSHITTHSDNRPFQCNVCDKRFKTKQHKNQHELYHLRCK